MPLRFIAALCAAFFAAGAAQAAKPEVYTGLFSNLALDGYDAVAYFVQGEPAKGSAAFSLEYKGARWRFASAENLERFRADPEAYAPRYGGYCAWAVAQGYVARGNPKYWTIVEGGLYLNYDAGVQRKWEADIPGFIARADANWPSVLE
ncbi:YHS domain-containing (seleno)protein [Amphiplicatus metriothermophilus]|uniref:YHS domain-containing protein n=1 Tax=Amphiplicatus metriothermophilus TaxID=1519374 RepID=A0A239PPP9_9PROT|nr:YHS domain-containing (seleno)protein [Amphiplicatus metriothermophilus]MBB5518823.1 YHS domain-containing protein [Amphiplicatus metriothermophilus]SNT72023.1 YHS domain-containing protein [Amphiplicatus metriothermophilus]